MSEETVPEVGSEWMYDTGAGKDRVIVTGTRTLVKWRYINGSSHLGSYEGELSSFQEGGTFTPAPMRIEEGRLYKSDGYVFKVYEVIANQVWGREMVAARYNAATQPTSDDWYMEAYHLDGVNGFRTIFKPMGA